MPCLARALPSASLAIVRSFCIDNAMPMTTRFAVQLQLGCGCSEPEEAGWILD